jgi:ABC-type uncharacterized transport system substrate-binding protein
MPRSLKHILWTLLCWSAILGPQQANAGEVLIVNSSQLQPYLQAIDGVNQVLQRVSYQGVKTIHRAETEIVSAGAIQSDPTFFNRKIEQGQVRVVVAVGSKALAAASGLEVPVIALLTPNPEKQPAAAGRIYQVPLMAPPAEQLAAIHAALPRIGRVGIIYDPQHSAALVDSFRAAAGQQGLSIVARELSEAKLLSHVLAGLQGEVEALLLVPDPTVISPITLDIFALFSLAEQVPVIAFAAQYLKHGAALAVYLTPAAMGEAAGRLAQQLLMAGPDGTVEGAQPTVEIKINQDVAEKLGLNLQHHKNSEIDQ